MSIPSDLRVVKVTADDFDRVISVRSPEDVYYGFDYLPSLYHTLINSSNSEGYAAVCKENYVGFCLPFRVDDGQTIVNRALRVSKSMEGRGVLKFLMTHLNNYVFDDPKIAHLAETFDTENKQMVKQVEEGNFTLMFKRKIRTFVGMTIEHFIHSETHGLAHFIPVEELRDIFRSEYLVNRLFTDGRITINWVPYKTIETNIEFIIQESNHLVGSNLTKSPCTSDQQPLLTSSTYFATTRGTNVTIDVFGHVGSDLREHIILHLTKIAQFSDKKILLKFICNNEEDVESIDIIMKNFTFTQCTSKEDFLFCVQKNLKDAER